MAHPWLGDVGEGIEKKSNDMEGGPIIIPFCKVNLLATVSNSNFCWALFGQQEEAELSGL